MSFQEKPVHSIEINDIPPSTEKHSDGNNGESCFDIIPLTEEQRPDLAQSRNDEDGSDTESIISLASTVAYRHEPFDTFKEKVIRLALDIFSEYAAHDLRVERLVGGGYNRVVAVTLLEPESQSLWLLIKKTFSWSSCVYGYDDDELDNRTAHQRYVLRIPRSDANGMEYHAVTSEYARRHLSYPVPRMLLFDKSDISALGKAYMLQERLSGLPLLRLWETLNFEQKKCIVRDISRILLELSQMKNKSAGIVSRFNLECELELERNIKLEMIPVPSDCYYETMDTSFANTRSAYDFLYTLCRRQEDHTNATELRDYDNCSKIFGGFREMITELHQRNFLADNSYYFYHGDFQPRNLLAEIIDDKTARISGVLDWDMACFAPKFMATRPPFFLWGDDSDHELDERLAVFNSADPEKREFKRIFEEEVGLDFYKDSYQTEYILARQMFHILSRGFCNEGDLYRAEKTVEEFEKLYPAKY